MGMNINFGTIVITARVDELKMYDFALFQVPKKCSKQTKMCIIFISSFYQENNGIMKYLWN